MASAGTDRYLGGSGHEGQGERPFEEEVLRARRESRSDGGAGGGAACLRSRRIPDTAADQPYRWIETSAVTFRGFWPPPHQRLAPEEAIDATRDVSPKRGIGRVQVPDTATSRPGVEVGSLVIDQQRV